MEEFRTERWRDMDADVEFTGKRIVHSDQLPISDLYTHLVLNDGLLRLEPLRFGVAGGKLESDIRLDGGKQPMQSRVKMSARGFKLKQLFPGFAPMQTSFGELNGDASLSGSGNSVAKILGGADGELKMLINDGAISKGLTEIAGLNVGNYLVTKLFGDDEVKINCAAADFGLQKGLMTSRLFVFDTENALVNVDGTELRKREARSRCHPAQQGLADLLAALAAVRARHLRQARRRGPCRAAGGARRGNDSPRRDGGPGGQPAGAGGAEQKRRQPVHRAAAAHALASQGAGRQALIQ